MARLPRTDEGMLTSSTALRDIGAAGNVNMDPDDGGGGAAADTVATAEVSLEEILTLYNQPINEEQAWAVCYQCCRTLAQKQRRRGLKSASHLGGDPRRIEGPGDVIIGRDGTVKLQPGGDTGKPGFIDSFTHSPTRSVWPQLHVNAGLLSPLRHSQASVAVWSISHRGHIVVTVCFEPCGEFCLQAPSASC